MVKKTNFVEGYRNRIYCLQNIFLEVITLFISIDKLWENNFTTIELYDISCFYIILIKLAVDYLAWGLFVGLAFFTLGFAVGKNTKFMNMMKKLIILCGIIHFLGFFGTLFINENLWYFAPMGYGVGTIIICWKMIRSSNILLP